MQLLGIVSFWVGVENANNLEKNGLKIAYKIIKNSVKMI